MMVRLLRARAALPAIFAVLAAAALAARVPAPLD